MKIAIYSEKKAEKEDIGWHRGGEDISYFKNNVRKDYVFPKFFFTATFTYTFEYDQDFVFFSYSYPYTMTDLRNDLEAIEADPVRSKYTSFGFLCKTLSGVDVPIITITSQKALNPQTRDEKKKAVILTARVHPGETVGSWMMRGAINFLTDPDNVEAQILRDNFVFKCIPMLNPDGVINGNYRVSLAGCDLNRRWKYPSKTLHPTIHYTKKLIKELHVERGVVLFCDMHGHSRKNNIFIYGCHNKDEPESTRILPYIMSKLSSMFDFSESKFGV